VFADGREIESLVCADLPARDERTNVDDGRIPFRVSIGVTGHRTLGDADAVAARVREALEWIRMHSVGQADAALELGRPSAVSPEATPITFKILSPLAEGADRIVVREALQLLKADGIVLEAVLPLEPADYVRDFGSASSRREFEELLGQAATCVTMRRVGHRDEAYERAGRYVVNHCDALIAVWDGERARGRGGTAAIVAYAEEQQQAVPTFRLSDPAPIEIGEPNRTGTGGFDPPRRPSTVQAFRRIDEYNRLRLDADQVNRAMQQRHESWNKLLQGSSIESVARPVADWAIPRFLRADMLALKYQRYHNLTASSLLAFAALAVACAAVGQEVHNWILSVLEVVLMLLVITGLVVGRRADWHDRWIGYRSLAEALRSAPFIVLAGFDNQREPAAQGRSGTGSDHWFQRAFTEAWQARPRAKIGDTGADNAGRLLIDGWIEEQITYHRTAVERFDRARRRLTWTLGMFFAATLVAASLDALSVAGLSILTISLPAIGCAFTGIRDQRQFALNQERSRRTADRLETVRDDAEPTGSLAALQSIVVEAQTIIDDESNQWWSVTEFQQLELVT
jgi:hypothetical protein